MHAHVNQDYRVYIPDIHFKIHSSGRPKADSGLKKSKSDTDLLGSSAQIDWYIDAEKKKIWLGKVGVEDSISKVFHEVIANKLYREVFRATKRVKVPRAVVSQVNIHEGYGVDVSGLKLGSKAFSIMSKKVSNFREGGQELIDQLNASPRKPLMIHNPTSPSEKLPVTSFWALAAYSKWLGDIDFLGTVGGNVGFQIKQDKTSGEQYCKTVKIDAGFVGHGEGLTETEIEIKDLVYSTAGQFISFDSLLPEERKEFLETLQEIVNYTDTEIKKLFSNFDTTGLTKEQQKIYKSQSERLQKILIARRDALRNLYTEIEELPPIKKQKLTPKILDVDIVVNNLVKPKVGVILDGLSTGVSLFASKFGSLF